ncbi:hypothetical protein [Qipengyuania sp. JC766]|uniref:PAS domain-containing protein n=1 Tax=Qipengyuania sp. JC766 TaxID=3232139 RepID=UPI0034597255
MDTLRGNFESSAFDDEDDWVTGDESGFDAPPPDIGTDERRMQVRAYNHWASLLGDRSFPSIEDLEPQDLPDFAPHSVLLDFTAGIEDPAVAYLGSELATECGAEDQIENLSDVPSRSLLSRITDHYLQILANQAPIGFEAEFVNQREATILYRGILLPYSSDGETIDFVFGVINWKEMADQATTDELLLEIDQALEGSEPEEEEVAVRQADPIEDWADGPLADNPISDGPASSFQDDEDEDEEFDYPEYEDGYEDEEADVRDLSDEDEAVIARLSALIQPRKPKRPVLDLDSGSDLLAPGPGEEDYEPAAPVPQAFTPEPMFEAPMEALEEEEDDEPVGIVEFPVAEEPAYDAPGFAGTANLPAVQEPPVPESGLYDCLADARELADAARDAESRSRATLYAAVGRAYDVALAARADGEEFAALLEENGLTMQDRAPMVPVVKLVFGANYDKTRVTEYAAVLDHAARHDMAAGSLGSYLGSVPGGLKGIVAEERAWRRSLRGEDEPEERTVREVLARSLRALEGTSLDEVADEGEEFAVLMIRRLPSGEIRVLGEVSDEVALIERVAKKIVD